MEKIEVYYSVRNGGDGSASLDWFLTQEEASWDQENQYEGFAEDCSGGVETFVGSDIYEEAIENRRYNQKLAKCKKEGLKFKRGEYDDEFKNLNLSQEEENDMSFLKKKPIEAYKTIWKK